jgi:hypothetical protein
MFLKWRSVIAIPAAIAGKYNRSDQVSFGRGTVRDMGDQKEKAERRRKKALRFRVRSSESGRLKVGHTATRFPEVEPPLLRLA